MASTSRTSALGLDSSSEAKIVQLSAPTLELRRAQTAVEDLASRLRAIAAELHLLPLAPAECSAEQAPSVADFARSLIRERRARLSYFSPELLGEPVWEILLDLFASSVEGKAVCVSSACIASGAPSTTALRYLTALEHAGLVARHEKASDRRVRYVGLTEVAINQMTELLARMAADREAARTTD